jgi:protein involved in polysaccharide export with SLBB domain
MDTPTSSRTIDQRIKRYTLLLGALLGLSLSGCTALFSPIDTIPASRVPPQFMAEPQANKVAIDVARLRQNKPEFYTLDSGDVLGVFIEGVLGNFNEAPPVNLPSPDSDLPPAMGFPIPVRADGTLSLPLVKPIPVRGLTIQQAEALIQRTYRDGDNPILRDDGRIIVTILRERTYRVFVVRQDSNMMQGGGFLQAQAQRLGVFDRSDLSSRGFVLRLPAYQNDVLNALTQTGGMPGLNAKAEVRVSRGDRLEIAARDRRLEEFYRSNSSEDFPYGIIPAVPDETNMITIPTRINPGEIPNLAPEDIILRDGDIVYVDNRETEVYYTGGLLGGSERPIPRDYDLDVLQAVSMAGMGIATGRMTNFFGGAAQNVPPTELIVLRQIPGRRQLAIRIDLNDAINDPRQRILVMAQDTLLLRYKPQEELINFASNVFYTFGIRRLFQ